MGSKYRAVAAVFISINVLLLITLIVAGMLKDGHRDGKEDPDGVRQAVPVERREREDLSLEDVGVEVGEEQDVKGGTDTGYLLLLSSVDSDMLIRILDSSGAAAKGERWQADIRDEEGRESFYEDDDEDGIVYVEKVNPGKYEVSVGGAGTSVITVRNSIRLTAVNDIRKIMVDESEVDASKEDTAVNEEADLETEGPDNSTYDLAGGSIGIDVSKYQKDIDWKRVKAAGIDYAIIRAGYRGSSTGVLVKDPYFEKNFAGAKEAGIKIGLYFFTQAVNPTEASEEAAAVAALISPDELSLPVYLDVESSGSIAGRADGLDINLRTENIIAFCSTLNSMGYKAGVYANKNWLTKKIDTARLEDYDIWLAQYRVERPDYNGRYSIWQYTSKGSVDGIEGFVDMDLVVGR
ncbi:MAG: glycoside hydrolase family 25 protein [Lachnospiraceae bacterium]|nr:glycoside hydrolase family 25 protein [Lachnospiraceae bacterium]